jgi:uncharacterized membrane protein
MTNDQLLLLFIVLGVVGVVIGLAVLLATLAGGAVVAYTVFVLGLWETTPILPILLFVLFPPSLIVFLVGLVMMQFLASRAAAKSVVQESELVIDRASEGSAKVDAKTRDAVSAQRRKLGYDD